MDGINVTVDGADRIARKFQKAARVSPGTFDKTTGRWAKRTANQLKKKKAPPTRPGQTYQRTRKMARSWQASRNRSMEWSIENRAQQKGRIYPSFVVGDRQAWMHKGRWWIASEEIEKKVPTLVKDIEKDVERLLF